jgi:hypothetical protein
MKINICSDVDTCLPVKGIPDTMKAQVRKEHLIKCTYSIHCGAHKRFCLLVGKEVRLIKEE